MGLILGIDPGAATGVAAYDSGKLVELLTIEPFQLERFLRERAVASPSVLFEDSRLETRLWNARQKGAYGAALATARSVGQVDAWCSLIASLCADMGIPAHGVSPTVKGAKVAAPAFGRITGWTKRCNQHERDAAMVAWKFRNSVALKGRTC
ncbi:hypothetical protein E8K88_02675 [Lampropedia aestuarii]|uniref:Uncharacterized protein n=1 Tax=Lampropedia aestuarii TaxID=2562762 RepID=A0A4S5BTI9_9BURK|nr:hypothetical protein [Lampropedia aestuarii]THJ36187.1 hypothetical protein E8K88_02675 [Lampropedia aestuarii]